MLGGKAHISEHVVLGFVNEGGELGDFGPTLWHETSAGLRTVNMMHKRFHVAHIPSGTALRGIIEDHTSGRFSS